MDDQLPEEISSYYAQGGEIGRLDRGIGPLELARMMELTERMLPPPPAAVLDIGGGPGRYAAWLARKGYRVHLIDAVPLHIEQAAAASAAQPETPIYEIRLGDARELPFAEATAAAVLLFGPLYHLPATADRRRALSEAYRVLQPGGLLLASAISRFASALVGFQRWWLADADFQEMLAQELQSGRHTPPQSWPDLFTTAYFHHPHELREEIETAGFTQVEIAAVEGPGWITPDLEARMADPGQREIMLTAVRNLEREPALLGMSPHIMAVGRKRDA